MLKVSCPRCYQKLMIDFQDVIPFCVVCGYYDWNKNRIDVKRFPGTGKGYILKQVKARNK